MSILTSLATRAAPIRTITGGGRIGSRNIAGLWANIPAFKLPLLVAGRQDHARRPPPPRCGRLRNLDARYPFSVLMTRGLARCQLTPAYARCRAVM
jgi:hypothetical protein